MSWHSPSSLATRFCHRSTPYHSPLDANSAFKEDIIIGRGSFSRDLGDPGPNMSLPARPFDGVADAGQQFGSWQGHVKWKSCFLTSEISSNGKELVNRPATVCYIILNGSATPLSHSMKWLSTGTVISISWDCQ